MHADRIHQGPITSKLLVPGHYRPPPSQAQKCIDIVLDETASLKPVCGIHKPAVSQGKKCRELLVGRRELSVRGRQSSILQV